MLEDDIDNYGPVHMPGPYEVPEVVVDEVPYQPDHEGPDFIAPQPDQVESDPQLDQSEVEPQNQAQS